jgi:hypothetical protein
MLGIMASQISGHLAAPSFLASITTGAGDQQGLAIASSGSDIFISGYDVAGGSLFQKISNTATVSVSKYLNDAHKSGAGILASDGSGNYYLAGSGVDADIWVIKMDSTGAIQAQKSYGGAYANSMIWDSTNNVGYVTSYVSASPYRGGVIKVDSSLAISWQKNFECSITADDTFFQSIGLDSSKNPYLFGFTEGGTAGYVVKMTTAGAVTWQVLASNGTFQGGAVDSSGNVYGVTFTGPALYKYNSSGTQQFTRRLTHSGLMRTYNNGVILGSDGYIYFVGYYATGSTPADAGFIAKYSTSGVIQWQRTISSATHNIRLKGIAVEGTTMYISGNIASNGGDVFLAALPTDGSLTGTYSLGGVNTTYAAGSFTEADPGYTSSVSTNILGTSTFSASNTSYTSTSSTATVTKVTV